ncbi:MAG: YidC/Oxa1 family rane protein insertase [Verrucomicrobiota bacterium]
MDRTAWVAVILCVLGLVAWEGWIFHQSTLKPTTVAASPAPGSPPPAPVASASAAPLASVAPVATPAPAPTTPSFALKTETLRNGDVELHFTNRGGGISEAVLLNHKAEHGRPVSLNSPEYLPIGAMIDNPAAPNLTEYEVKRDGDAVQLKQTSADNVTIQKRFFFPKKDEKDNYLVELDVDLTNGSTKSYANPGYFLGLGSVAPIHGNDYPSPRLVWCVNGKPKGIDVGWFTASNGFLGVGQRAARPFYQENVPTPGAEWVAVSNQFFTALVAPLSAKANSVWGRRVEVELPTGQKLGAVEGAMGMPGFELQPGQTTSVRYQMWIGPKLYNRLARLEHDEAEIMEFGIFKIVSQALLNALNTLHNFLGNYAAAILALTAIIKLILWPLQNKANRSARQMAALGPKIQELREKYKDDPTKMNQEVMKMYKQYGINPVGGCLPMLIQIPIFFGLFTMLRQAVELRNSSFLWIHDLSQPDTVAHLPVLGWPVNILPIIMAATSFWMMQITPKSGDPTQQRMMMFTPIIFVIFCYNFAAALALYYTVQNLFTILQLYQNRKQPMPTLEKVQPPGKPKRR